MPVRLTSGALGAPGGARPGAGRPPDWLKEKCRGLIEKRKLFEFVADVASGKDIDQVITPEGETAKIPAKVGDRIDAVKMLADRGFGKAEQSVSHEVNFSFLEMVIVRIQSIVQRVVPIKCPHCEKMLNVRKDMSRELSVMAEDSTLLGPITIPAATQAPAAP